MSIELKVPSAGESITEVIVVEWLKAEGAHANRDEALALMQKTKPLAPRYTAETNKILHGGKAGRRAESRLSVGHAVSPAAASAPVRVAKTHAMSRPPFALTTSFTLPSARTLPWCRMTTRSCAITSSMR